MVKRNYLGFSLFELMLVCSMISILILIALPSYQALLRKGYRKQVQVQLAVIATQLQKYYDSQDTFQGAVLTGYKNGQYRIQWPELSNTYFRLTATPLGMQQSDPYGMLSLDSQGRHWASRSECWT